MRVQSPVATENGGWVHKLDGSIIPEPEDVPVKTHRAPDKKLDKIYRKFLSVLPLNDIHYKQLKERGMSDEEIKYFNYKSLPSGSRDLITSYFSPVETEGVPGFGLKKNKLMISGRPGLLIPAFF